MRFWLSGPRLLGGLVRPGISIGPEDIHPRLPSWRRYELRKGLQEAAKARGETMTKEDADYAIDKALAGGLLDSNGNVSVHAVGSRDEIITQIIEGGAAWGMPVVRKDAERMADRAISEIKLQRGLRVVVWFVIVAIIIGVVILFGQVVHPAIRSS
jgi:hypothetical protein